MQSTCALASPQVAVGERSFIEILEEKDAVQPLRGRTDLINILGYVSLMSQITVAALNAFERHEWRQFDALVGECSCQIRAARIMDLANQHLSSKIWRQEIRNERERARSILRQLPVLKSQIEKTVPSNRQFKEIYHDNVKATEVCRRWEILQYVSENIRFIVECYLLTQTKILFEKEDCFYQLFDITDVSHLARFNCSLDGGGTDQTLQLLTKKKLKELVHTFQQDLASLSIQYLKREVRHLQPSPVNRLAQEVVERNILQDELGRSCAPCFYSLESLIQRIMDKNQQILIDVTRWTPNGTKIDRIKMLYISGQETNLLKSATPLLGDQPVFVIIGNSVREDQEELTQENYISLFHSHSLDEILSANWAQHAQYPGSMDQRAHLPEDTRRSTLAKKAEMIGCTPSNMSLFVANHILCDRLDSALVNQELL